VLIERITLLPVIVVQISQNNMFVSRHHDKSLESSAAVVEEVPHTIKRFSRKALNDEFGPGTSALGFTKHGTKSVDVVETSPAVKNKVVLIRGDGKIDKRCEAVKQTLVTLDDDGDVVKSESLLCQKQVVLTKSEMVSKTSSAVKAGYVTFTQSNHVDKRCKAFRNGWLVVDKEGNVDESKSILCEQYHLTQPKTADATAVVDEKASSTVKSLAKQFDAAAKTCAACPLSTPPPAAEQDRQAKEQPAAEKAIKAEQAHQAKQAREAEQVRQAKERSNDFPRNFTIISPLDNTQSSITEGSSTTAIISNSVSRPTTESQGRILVSLKTLTGRTIAFDVAPYDTVLSLKQKIMDRQGVTVSQQRLVFSAKELADSRTLRDNGISNSSTIHLITRVFGGGGRI